MTGVVVLRPEPGASETVRRAEAAGLKAVAVPLFTIEPIAWTLPDASRFDALLLTSANAVRHAGQGLQQLRGLPAHTVGAATAEAAREAGFDIASSGDAGVERLLGSLEPDLKLLHLAGEDRKDTAGARQQITALIVYRAVPVPSPALDGSEGQVTLIHSPRAARRFAELATGKGTITLAAISEAAAESAGSGWKAVEVAEQPNDAALLALAARLCNIS